LKKKKKKKKGRVDQLEKKGQAVFFIYWRERKRREKNAVCKLLYADGKEHRLLELG